MKIYKNIIFDFDGVLVDSNSIRTEGYRELFLGRTEKIDDYMEFIIRNPGLSRYRKIRFFYEEILRIEANNNTITADAFLYSEIVKARVADAPEIVGAINFLQSHFNNYDFALVSASDQDELREICQYRGLDKFFKRIFGSPAEKYENILRVISECVWQLNETIYIGDSINDYNAAHMAGIDFVAFGLNFSEQPGITFRALTFNELATYLPVQIYLNP